jgi:hypothetical protein
LKTALKQMNYLLTLTIPPHKFVFESLFEMNLINKFTNFKNLRKFNIGFFIFFSLSSDIDYINLVTSVIFEFVINIIC